MPLRRQTGDLRLEHAAQLDRVVQALLGASDGEAEEALERSAVDRPDAADLALLHLDDAHRGELAQRLPGDGLGDAEGGGDLALRGQLVAGLEAAVDDGLGQALDHGVAEAARRNVLVAEDGRPGRRAPRNRRRDPYPWPSSVHKHINLAT